MDLSENMKKGSFTVEAACIMPLLLLTVFGVIYLSVFVHDRGCLCAAAYESAVCGSFEGIPEKGDVETAAGIRCINLASGGLLFLDGLTESVSTGNDIQVTYRAKLHGLFGFEWNLCSEGRAFCMQPSERVREKLIRSGG